MGHRLCKKNKTRLHGSCASFSHTVVETQVSSKKGLCMYVCMYVWSSHIAEYGSTG